jgi:hypothetical protein
MANLPDFLAMVMVVLSVSAVCSFLAALLALAYHALS